jgi:hypothetical protein
MESDGTRVIQKSSDSITPEKQVEAVLTEHSFEDLADLAARLATLEKRVDDLAGRDVDENDIAPAGSSAGDSSRESEATRQAAESGAQSAASAETSSDTRETGHESGRGTADDVAGAVGDVVDEVAESWGDTGDRLDARKAAARAVVEYARTADAVGKSDDRVDELYEQYPVPGQDRETWWRQNIRPVLREVGEYNQGLHGYVVDLEA